MDVYNNSVFVVKNVFEKEFVEEVIKQYDTESLVESQVYTGEFGTTDKKSRVSMQGTIDADHALVKRISEIVEQVNTNYLHINVSEYSKENHFLKYPPSGHFREHNDVIFPTTVTQDHRKELIRKISAICLLSDNNTFEGGEFIVFNEQTRSEMTFCQGDVIVFPSYVMHQIDPITTGVRYSSIHWSHGCF